MKELTNDDRANSAYRAVLVYSQGRGYEPGEIPEVAMQDLLTDMMHLADQYADCDDKFGTMVAAAKVHYEDEIDETRNMESKTVAQHYLNKYPDQSTLAKALDLASFPKKQDWDRETTIWTLPDDSQIHMQNALTWVVKL